MAAAAVVSDLQIEVLRSTIVVPAEPVENSILFLSNIDQESMYKVETIYCYAPNASKSSVNVAKVIEDALGKALVPYSFLAGRFRPNITEQRLEVNCNGAGVLFAAASSKLSLSDVGDLFVPNPAFRSFLVQPSDSLGLFETPIATFQVTRFSCGGFVLGMTLFHSMMDGNSISAFLSNLGSLARGQGLVIKPNPSREFLKARSPPQPEYYERVMCKTLRVASFDQIPLLPFNPTLSSVNNTAPTHHIFKSFPVSSQMLLALKSHALRDGALAKCSSFEAILAHVFQKVGRSKSGADPASLISMFMAVDFGRKMQPAVDPSFCGNAVVAACVAATAEELRSSRLSGVARIIQEALGDITEEYVRSWTDFWEMRRIGPARIPMGACFSGWWKLPFYEIDLGWGKPVFSGPVPNQLVGFIVLLDNGAGDGGANVYLSLEPRDMAAFESSMYVY